MEKLVYVGHRAENAPAEAFAAALLARTAPRLREMGAQQLKVCVRDAAVAAGAKLELTPDGERLKDALVTFWLEQAQERAALEDVLREAPGLEQWHGFLVVESEPLVNRKRAAAGERSPGFALVTAIVPKPGLAYAEFLRRWYEEQRDMAIETQATFQYIRNEIVRPLTAGAPGWAAIVEEGFPIGALDDPHVFYDAVADGRRDDARLAANAKRMFETVDGFLDLSRVNSNPMSEYRFA